MTDTPQALATAALDAALLAAAAAAALYDAARETLTDLQIAEELAETAAHEAKNVYDAACELVIAARSVAGFEA